LFLGLCPRLAMDPSGRTKTRFDNFYEGEAAIMRKHVAGNLVLYTRSTFYINIELH